MKNVVIYGSGSLATEVLEMELSLDSGIHFCGYLNDHGHDVEFERKYDLPLLKLEMLSKDLEILVCIADPDGRKVAVDKINKTGCLLCTYIHPTALISRSAFLSEGCILFPFVVVSANARVGSCVVINTYSGVGHDVVVGDFTTISAHVDLTGFVIVGSCCFFGSGSRVAPRKKIGSHSKIGTGISVIKSLKANSKLLPLPNKVIYD